MASHIMTPADSRLCGGGSRQHPLIQPAVPARAGPPVRRLWLRPTREDADDPAQGDDIDAIIALMLRAG